MSKYIRPNEQYLGKVTLVTKCLSCNTCWLEAAPTRCCNCMETDTENLYQFKARWSTTRARWIAERYWDKTVDVPIRQYEPNSLLQLGLFFIALLIFYILLAKGVF